LGKHVIYTVNGGIMPRFFVDKRNIFENEIIIDGEDVAHITKVLRMKIGDEMTLCDGEKNDYRVEIIDIDKKYIKCKIITVEQNKSEPKVFVTLFQGIPKSDKMEYIIQKCTELGISKIVPVNTKRCVAKVKDNNKISRWQKIAMEASKQSQRGIVPQVCGVMGFEEALKELLKCDISILPYEEEKENNLKSHLDSFGNDVETVGIMIGPEGGFDKEEVEMAKALGIKTITLGNRILRTETAGEAVLAILMFYMNEI